MPTSRTRRTRNRSNADRKRERARKARAERAASDEQSSAGDHARHFSEADWAVLRESARAAADGRVERALELYDGVQAVAGSEPSRGMRQLLELGDDAPPWAWSRWIREQAFRWFSSNNQSRIEAAFELAADVAYPTGIDADKVGLVLARDWIVRQVLLYELGGLGDFVVNVAGEDLLARGEPMIEWRCALMGAYQFVDETADCTRLLDLETEEWIEVLNVGSMMDVEPGGYVLGRVVPISSGPGQMFESRPLKVDERTARRFGARWMQLEEQMQADDCGCDPDECDGLSCAPLDHDPPNWWEELQDASHEGRVPELFSLHLEYPLLTDVPSMMWRCAANGAPDPELVSELLRSGTPRPVADAVQVAVYGLVSAPLHGKGLTAGGPIYGAALLEPGAMNVLRERFTLPQYAAGWRAVAELVVEPARTRCLSLAQECARFGSQECRIDL
jgi:hypothetical protein